MLVSYEWLKHYVELPEPKKLADILNTRVFEVEGIEKKGDDFVIDIDVLPNRSHDCLSHIGIAKEIALLTGKPFKDLEVEKIKGDFKSEYNIKIESDACPRYTACEIKNIEVKESPEYFKVMLETLGQRSINNVVDIVNLVMIETGQPLHAFDADLIDGKDIYVKNAEKGEKMTTLDGQDLELDEETLVIKDSKNPLVLAGIKGGNKAGVNEKTTNIVLEAANWNRTLIRKTTQKYNIKTDSSKRFENEITPELTEKALERAVEMISKYANTSETKVSEVIDIYPRVANLYKVGVSTKEVNNLLGLNLKDSEIEEIFDRSGFEWKKVNTKDEVVKMSQEFVGVPYKLGASVVYDAPKAFDCSSFSAYLYAQNGLSIPRVSVDQYVFGKEITKEELEPGDLIFTNTGEGKIHHETIEFLPGIEIKEGVDHLRIYLGDNKVIHSTRTGEGVVVIEDFSTIPEEHIVGYRRMAEKDAERYVVTAPVERLDIRIKQDLIEEIGRVYGYDNVSEQDVDSIDRVPEINKEFEYNNIIKGVLCELGFSEVFTGSFVEKGDIAVLKPLAEDKGFLRASLVPLLEDALERNLKNADLFGVEDIKVFEIGKVFAGQDEKMVLGIGVTSKNKKTKSDDIVKSAIDKLNEALRTDIKENGSVVEINLDELKLVDLNEHFTLPQTETKKVKPISPYPFVLRDVAVWVPGENKEDEVLELIQKEAGDLLIKSTLFDIFSKDGKTSYAFRLVLQSMEKTLTDEEINPIMDSIYSKMEDSGWEIR